MIVVSWNINSVRARLESLCLLIEQHAPDVILLQETKVRDEQFPIDFFESHHYNLAFWGEKSYNGVAIASRIPLCDIRQEIWAQCHQSRYIEATIGEIRIGCVYVPNGQQVDTPAYHQKLEFLDQMCRDLSGALKNNENFCLAGDFNVVLADGDVAQPERWKDKLLCSKAERTLMHQFMKEGWKDCGQTDGEKNSFTWWDYRGRSFALDRGLRIDYFLLTPKLHARLKDYQVLKEWRSLDRPSDHAPLKITIN